MLHFIEITLDTKKLVFLGFYSLGLGCIGVNNAHRFLHLKMYSLEFRHIKVLFVSFFFYLTRHCNIPAGVETWNIGLKIFRETAKSIFNHFFFHRVFNLTLERNTEIEVPSSLFHQSSGTSFLFVINGSATMNMFLKIVFDLV